MWIVEGDLISKSALDILRGEVMNVECGSKRENDTYVVGASGFGVLVSGGGPEPKPVEELKKV